MNNEEIIYHFIGIKGSGMSALALVLYGKGKKVQGSDIDQEFYTQKLLEQKSDIKILPFDSNNIKENMIIIAGSIFTESHQEIKRAIQLGLLIYRYQNFLGELIKNENNSVAIAGCHGKTTTTGLLSHLLSGIKPTSFLIGDGTGFGLKDKSNYFVFEACEYKRHFLNYHPDYLILTNIDFDHPDYFQDMNDVFKCYQSFMYNIKKAIFCWGDDDMIQKLISNVPFYYYGFGSNNHFQARNIKLDESGCLFDVYCFDKFFGHFKTNLYGTHNILNHLAVISFAFFQKVSYQEIFNQIITFKGVNRRFNFKKISNYNIIDDYAHHPTEIKASLEAVKQKFSNQKIVVIFEPHTFSRIKTFLDEFAKSLNQADYVYLVEIYGTKRELVNDSNVSIYDLLEKIKGGQLIDQKNISVLLNHGIDHVFVFMGAGNIQTFQQSFEQLLLKFNT